MAGKLVEVYPGYGVHPLYKALADPALTPVQVPSSPYLVRSLARQSSPGVYLKGRKVWRILFTSYPGGSARAARGYQRPRPFHPPEGTTAPRPNPPGGRLRRPPELKPPPARQPLSGRTLRTSGQMPREDRRTIM